MYKIFTTAFVGIAAIILTGCASVPMASSEADTKAKSFQTEVQTGKANLYIYRNETMGAAIKMTVLLDGQLAGDTASKTYIFKSLDPGSHTVVSKTENDATVTFDAEPGKNYFIWQEVKMGMFAPRSQLHLVADATGQAGVSECKLVQ